MDQKKDGEITEGMEQRAKFKEQRFEGWGNLLFPRGVARSAEVFSNFKYLSYVAEPLRLHVFYVVLHSLSKIYQYLVIKYKTSKYKV